MGASSNVLLVKLTIIFIFLLNNLAAVFSESQIRNENSITVKATDNNKFFYENSERPYSFTCDFKGIPVQELNWFYGWNDGSKSPRVNQSDAATATFFIPSKNITSVICEVVDTNGITYSGFKNVTVFPTLSPKILNDQASNSIQYPLQKTLECRASGTNLEFRWLNESGAYLPTTGRTYIKKDYSQFSSVSVLTLDPLVKDGPNIKYTCEVSNHLNSTKFDFHVKVVTTYWTWTWVLATVTCTFILGITIVISVYLKHRANLMLRLSKQEIRKYHGFPKRIFPSQLEFGDKIGGGHFSSVYFAIFIDQGSRIPVAVKRPKKREYLRDLLKECEALLFLRERHPHVVDAIGAVLEEELLANQKAHLVLEYCPIGGLENYLRASHGRLHDNIQNLCDLIKRPNGKNEPVVLNMSVLVKWSRDIADGMVFLESKGFVHRDLAVRNILLARDDTPEGESPSPERFVVKIADFGLTRNYRERGYYRMVRNWFGEWNLPQNVLPITSLSPEAMENKIFTNKSDVWAFGVTMWEIFTLGKTPYDDWRVSADLLRRLKAGETLGSEEIFPEQIWEIMESCWNLNPVERPDFSELKHWLGKYYDTIKANQCHCIAPPPLPPDYAQVGVAQTMDEPDISGNMNPNGNAIFVVQMDMENGSHQVSTEEEDDEETGV